MLWEPEYELEYARGTSEDELLRRSGAHYDLFGFGPILDDLPIGSVIVEIGCGAAGGILRFVPGKFRKIAIDPLIDTYRSDFWVGSDVEALPSYSHSLPIEDELSSLTICLEVLDHCESMDYFRASQRELYRITRPGCHIAFMVPARSAACDGHPCHPGYQEIAGHFMEMGLKVAKNNFGKEGTWLLMKKLT